jgi:hypothetical protein
MIDVDLFLGLHELHIATILCLSSVEVLLERARGVLYLI